MKVLTMTMMPTANEDDVHGFESFENKYSVAHTRTYHVILVGIRQFHAAHLAKVCIQYLFL